ncbi:MAG: Ig-like domain-containing protein [Myxococcota bacterium]
MRRPVLMLVFVGCSSAKDEGSSPSDAIAPAVTLLAPLDGEVLTGAVDLSATAEDDVGVVGLVFAAGGNPVASLAEPPWEAVWDSTAAVNGNYRISATATDDAGNAGSAEAEVWIQNEGGLGSDVVRIVTPVDGATVCGTVTAQAAIGVEPASATFSVDGVDVAFDEEAPYTWEWNTLGVSNGSHSLRVTATDADGAQGQHTIRVDVQDVGSDCDNLPSVQLTGPEDGAFVDGTVDITADASDDAGVLAVRFFVDNGMLFEDGSVPYGTEWDAAAFAEGPHTVKVTAIDTAEHEVSDEITVTIDRTPPTVYVDTPGDGDRVDGLVVIEADASDNIGIAQVEIRVDDVSLATVTSPPWSVEWDADEAGHGDHAIEVVATDYAGFQSSDTVRVSVDSPPTIRITSPATGDTLTSSTTVTASVSDDGDVETVRLYVDGDHEGSDESSPWSFRWDACVARSGTYTLLARAYDDGGNIAEDEIEVTVDRPPEIELVELDGNAEPTQELSARVASDDAIVDVVFTVDGAAIGTDTSGSAGSCELECSCEEYAVTWDASAAESGTYSVVATVTDAAGDTATARMSVEVDRDADGDGDDGEEWGGTDCDDDDASVHAGATETCDGRDEDCDGTTDEAAAGAPTWYLDADGDGYGVEEATTADCAEPAGYAARADDCDDADASVYPGARDDTMNTVDDDCDGLADDDAYCNVYAPLENGSSATRTYSSYVSGETYTEEMVIASWSSSTGAASIRRTYSGAGTTFDGEVITESVQCDAAGYAVESWAESLFGFSFRFDTPRVDLLPEEEMVVGASWTYAYSSSYHSAEGTMTVTDAGSVTVDAGTFEAVVVRNDYELDQSGELTSGTIETWYVPGLGIVWVENTKSDGTVSETRELQSYSGFYP